jgi:hypothetical protein
METSQAQASVYWIPGQVPPTGWTLNPVEPTTTEVILFQGPTQVYENSGQAASDLGGTPRIIVDPVGFIVELVFEGPAPTHYADTWSPVCGLSGSFGPLDAGLWIFKYGRQSVPVRIPFVVTGRLGLHVDGRAPGPVHDGRTWATAFTCLQDALLQAASGDQILVAQGVYTPDEGQAVMRGDRKASFRMKSGVTLKGGYAGCLNTDPDAQCIAQFQTVLSGDLAGDDKPGFVDMNDNSFHVVEASEVDADAVLAGVTITGGRADGLLADSYGGAIYIHRGSPSIVQCTLEGNWAVCGGAIHTIYGSPSVSHCTIRGNWASMRGGGFYAARSCPVVDNCVFSGNCAEHAILSAGGAVCCVDGTLTVTSSTLADNVATTGKALAFYSWTRQTEGIHRLTHCILWDGGSEIAIDAASVPAVTYSCIQGNYAGTGNISSDPRLIQQGSWTAGIWCDGDYHLRPDSPCINKGSPAYGSGSGQTDMDGGYRVVGGRIDIGADEQPSTIP